MAENLNKTGRKSNRCGSRGGMRAAGRWGALILSVILAAAAAAGPAFAAVPSAAGTVRNACVSEAEAGTAADSTASRSIRALDAGSDVIVSLQEPRGGSVKAASSSKKASKKKSRQKLKLHVSKRKIPVGKTVVVRAKGVKGGAKVTYTSSDPAVAAVSASGKVTAKKVGTVKIRVSAAETSKYKAASKSVTIKVLPGAAASLTAEVQTRGIKLVWSRVAGANSYLLYRNGKKIAKIKDGGTVTYTDEKANKKGKKYVYKLVARASTGTSTLSKTVRIVRRTAGQSSSSPDESGDGSGGGSGDNSGGGSGDDSGGGSSDTPSGEEDGQGDGQGDGQKNPVTETAPSGVRYCFESRYVASTLSRSQNGDLAVIDMDGVSATVINTARNRGVKIYGYLNAGALESDRSYFNQLKNLAIAEYDGWNGEYWVDVTNKLWTDHLIEEARKIKAAGATGIYLDNTDILYMVEEGFRDDRTRMIRTAPTPENVYTALRDVVKTIQNTVGITVMPNGGETFVERFIEECPGVIREVNQESVLYVNNRAQSAKDTRYLTRYLDQCKAAGITVRGIEYINTQEGAQKAVDYYRDHGWQSIYISTKKKLTGE